MSMHREPIRIYLVEDTAFTSGETDLFQLLTNRNDVVVVGKAENLSLGLYQFVKPDIFLLGIRLFHKETYESIRRVKLALPQTRIVVVSDNDVALMQAAQAGVQGCFSVAEGLENLVEDLRNVHEGNVVVSGNLALKLIRERQHVYEHEARYANLTARERDIIHYLGYGLRNVEIGRQLGISDRTVQYHAGRIMRKLGCRNRSELVSYVSRIRGARDVGN